MMPIILALLARTGLLRQLPSLRVRQWITQASAQRSAAVPQALPALRQLLVDVSVVHWHDAGTGIQRVVRSVLAHLEKNPPPGFRVCCVVAQRKQPYLYAHSLGQPRAKKVDVGPGDIFLGLDLAAHLLPSHLNQLLNWKLAGVALHFVVYDMLPLTHPAHFTRPRVRHFERWARLLAIMADGLLCISHSVRIDAQTWFQENTGLSASQLRTTVVPLGGDLPPESLTDLPSEGVIETIAMLKSRPWALMVGTLEPRKCHTQVLDAFEQLWQQGDESALVLVGQRGWQTDALQLRITQHAQLNRNLFWFQAATDADLERFYQAATGVLAASVAEGYGLPLSEALNHLKPLLVRDIPVFREVAGTNAIYFTDDTPVTFSLALRQWLTNARYTAGVFENPPIERSWADATIAIVHAMGIGADSIQPQAVTP